MHSVEKSIRKIWELPYRTHSYLLPLLCRSLSIFDHFCMRSLNFVQRCLAHDSDVVKFISDYCIKYVRRNYCIVRMYCSVCNGISAILKWCSLVR